MSEINQHEIQWSAETEQSVLWAIQNRCQGKERAMTRKVIATDLEIPLRVLRSIVRTLNARGIPILPSNSGYYYATNPDEIDRVALRYHAMGVNNIEHSRYLKTIARKIRERSQIVIKGVG